MNCQIIMLDMASFSINAQSSFADESLYGSTVKSQTGAHFSFAGNTLPASGLELLPCADCGLCV
jgi:hypothetical protein